MAQSRARQKTKKGMRMLNPNVWNPLYTKVPDLLDNKKKNNYEVHCHKPLCVGYTESTSFEHLEYDIEAYVSKNYSYTIYLSARADDNKEIDKWFADLKEYLSQHPDSILHELLEKKERVKTVKDWRESESWKLAYRITHELLEEASRGDNKYPELKIKEIGQSFINRSPTITISPKESEDHVINDAILYLSFAELFDKPQQSDDSIPTSDDSLEEDEDDISMEEEHLIVNVFHSKETPNKLMNYVMTKAKSKGYCDDHALIHISADYTYSAKKLKEKEEEAKSHETDVENEGEKELDPRVKENKSGEAMENMNSKCNGFVPADYCNGYLHSFSKDPQEVKLEVERKLLEHAGADPRLAPGVTIVFLTLSMMPPDQLVGMTQLGMTQLTNLQVPSQALCQPSSMPVQLAQVEEDCCKAQKQPVKSLINLWGLFSWNSQNEKPMQKVMQQRRRSESNGKSNVIMFRSSPAMETPAVATPSTSNAPQQRNSPPKG